MGEDRGVYRVLVVSQRSRDHWGDQDVDGKIIFFRKLEWVVRTG
jgi:hypothetical protein